MILASDNGRWRKLCAVIGRPEYGADPRFATMGARRKRQEEVDALIAEWTRTRTRDEIMDEFGANDLLCGIVRELDEVMTDPHLHERGTLREVDHPDLGRMTIFTSPLRFNGESNAPRSHAPTIGKDNDAFFTKELGLTREEIAALRERKVI